MKYLNLKEYNKLKNLKKKNKEIFRIKCLLINCNIKKKYRNKYYLQYNKISNNNFNTKIKNRCNYTFNSKSYIRFFGLSRNIYKKLRRNGYICGIFNSSW